MDILLKTLNSGLEAKRRGDFENALLCYHKAQELAPLDRRPYMNSMKVLIGIGEYEQAFRHLLILCHFVLIEGSFNDGDGYNESFYQDSLQRFLWDSNELTEIFRYQPKLIKKGIKKNPILRGLIHHADNLIFYMGHCYVGEFKDQDGKILDRFGKQKEYFSNLNSSILGQPRGATFRNAPEEGYFLSIGFIYAHMNLNLSIETKREAVDYYLNSNTKIRTDIWDYWQFLPQVKIDPSGRRPESIIAHLIAENVEQKFNTKIFKFGVAQKGTQEYESLAPSIIKATDNTEFLFWFLIPFNVAGDAITNDYYVKERRLRGYDMSSPNIDVVSNEFESILRPDWMISEYIKEELLGHEVDSTGSIDAPTYALDDNIVPYADKIEDLEYRYFRLYTPRLC